MTNLTNYYFLATLVWTNNIIHTVSPGDSNQVTPLTPHYNTFMKPVIRLSVSEAAKLFGVSQRTVRRAIKDQEITYVVVQGRYKINFESLLRWSQRTTTIRNKRDKHGIGQFVNQWNMKNKLFSPNPKSIDQAGEEAN